MITYSKKNRFVNIQISWFGYKYSFWDNFSFNAHFHVKKIEGAKKVPGKRKDSHTIEIDLEQDQEAIFANFTKQIRQQFKISETEGVTTRFNTETDTFVSFFNDFAKKRNTYPTSKKRIDEMGSSLKLCFAEKDGVLLVAHSYLVDEEMGIVRMQHAATCRLDETMDKQLASRANKYLIAKNILHYKEKGFKIFDMGGYAADTTDEGLQGINRFKLMFGGKVVPCADYYSFNYWLFKKIASKLGMSAEV